MFDFARFLENNPNGTMGVSDGSTVTMRFMRYLFNQDNRVFFSTSAKKDLFRKIRENPHVTFSTHQPNFGKALSLYGTVEVCEDLPLKRRVLDESSLIRDIFSSADNPDFVLFYIFVETIETLESNGAVEKYQVLEDHSRVKPAVP